MSASGTLANRSGAVYLDNAATTPVRREVLEAIWPHLVEKFGNPSSHHETGERAARALADARSRVAAVLGCAEGEVIFTSGGTEADNLAIIGMALAAPRGRHIVTTTIEHPAVLQSCDYLARHHGFEVTLLETDGTGLVDAAALAFALRPDSTLVSVMQANNEVGTVQPIAELARAAAAVGARFHTDAVQGAGWLPLPVGAVDAIAISGHKLGTPAGIGALYLRRGVRIEPLIHGGGQERGRRAGTENVAAAVGLAVALELAACELAGRASHVAELRDDFIGRVLTEVPGALLTGRAPGDPYRLPSIASFCFPGTHGEAVLLELERRGITCSSGSACAAGDDEPSHVLLALGYDAAVAQTAVRFSLGRTTTSDELDRTVDAIRESIAAVRG